jgi:hypothetical protein
VNKKSLKMKRQKNYRKLRRLSPARNRLNEIKSRADAPDKRHSDATVYAENNSLFDENTEKAAYGEPPEDRFNNTPLPDFQFDWDEEFFGTALPDGNELKETIPFELRSVEEVQVTNEDAEVSQENVSVIQEKNNAVNIPEPAEQIPTVETEPEQQSTVTVAAAPARFLSVKRQMALAAREAEKMKKPEKKSEAPSLNVRHAPSFRSFVVSTIQKLMEQQRFLLSEPESSRFLAREFGIGKKEEPAISETSVQEKSQVGITRWNNPLIAAVSTGLGQGAKEKKSKSPLPGEKQPATRSSSKSTKSKPAPGSYELNAARITLMEARINAKAISSNMRMKW